MRRTKLLYLEVAESLRKKILNGDYPVDSLIPSEIELENMYKVSKITIRKAVELLVADGYLEKRSGRGTKVISDRLFNNLSKARSFSSLVEASGQELTKEIRSLEKVDLTTDQYLGALFGEEAYKLTRLYYLNNQPYVYFEHYLSILGDEKHLKVLRKSLYKWLDHFGKEVANFEDSFKVRQIDDEMKGLLETGESTLLERTRITKDVSGEVVEVSIALYDTNKYPYKIDYDV